MMKKNTLIIRADADEKIGTGHIMRCIALAQEWKRRDSRVIFISNCTVHQLRDRIKSFGFQLENIQHAYPHRKDIENTIAVIKRTGAENIVVDGYHFDEAYHTALKKQKIKLAVLDDYNHLPFYNTDILINQNLGAEKIRYSTLPETIRLTGSEYIMLRDEFLNCKDDNQIIPGKVEKIVVSMGGSDPDNTTLKIVKALDLIDDTSLEIKIILGPENRHVQSIKKLVSPSNLKYEILSDPDNMPELLIWADIVISAGGSTSWELLYLNKPAVFLINAENQIKIVETIETLGAGINAGWHEKVPVNTIAQKIKTLIESAKTRDTIRKNSRKVVNGKGREKITLSLLHGESSFKLTISIVCDQDSWINSFVKKMASHLKEKGHDVKILHLVSELSNGDIAFFLGCSQMIPSKQLELNTHNLVTHESDLPAGKGWSPMTWQILEGKSSVKITLFEAAEAVDSGVIYSRKKMQFKGHELVDELRKKQGEYSIRLCEEFIENYPDIVAKAGVQKGKESFYKKRSPEDSRLDPDKTIREQFNLMRVADNVRYPLFFVIDGHQYELAIKKTRDK